MQLFLVSFVRYRVHDCGEEHGFRVIHDRVRVVCIYL